jgi:ABC-type transport system involved in cytochrome bd biosynthesis fused ATPase/permease subunit
MVSHEEWHRKYFDRVIFMSDGKILTDGNQENILIPEPG